MSINAQVLNSKIGTALSYPFIIKDLGKKLYEMVEFCDKIIVLTDWYKNVLIRNNIPENKVELVKQALPHQTRVVRKIKSGQRRIRLIFIGRIDPIKGIHLLIQAVMELPFDKIQLDIYGPVTDMAFYEEWREKTNDSTNIQWKGVVAQHEVVSIMQEYDMLILPSIFLKCHH